MARLGILGGTFNPPHNAHLGLARAARDQLGLDRVVMIPSHVPPHKPVEDEPGAEVRYELCVAACDGEQGLEASRIELDREPPSFMVDTLEQIAAENPGDELFLILGEDAAASLGSWRNPERILELTTLAWAARPDHVVPEAEERVLSVLEPFGPTQTPIRLEMAPDSASSTQVRELCQQGASLGDLVSGSVEKLILTRGLYRGVQQMSSTTSSNPVLDGPAMAAEIVRFAQDKKAVDVLELDLRGIVDYTDGFVIATARSDRQAKAIHDGILAGMKKEHGISARRIEGLPEGRWVLIDFIDVVVHIFQAEARELYRLEKLWGDAPKVKHADLPEPPAFNAE